MNSKKSSLKFNEKKDEKYQKNTVNDVSKEQLKGNPFKRTNINEKKENKKNKNVDVNNRYEPEKDYKEDCDEVDYVHLNRQFKNTGKMNCVKNASDMLNGVNNYNSNKSTEMKNTCPRPKKKLNLTKHILSPAKSLASSRILEKENNNNEDAKLNFDFLSNSTFTKNKILNKKEKSAEKSMFPQNNLNRTNYTRSNSNTLNFNKTVNQNVDFQTNSGFEEQEYLDHKKNVFLENYDNYSEEKNHYKTNENGYKYNNTYNLNHLKTNLVTCLYKSKKELIDNNNLNKTNYSRSKKMNSKEKFLISKTDRTFSNSKIKSHSKDKSMKTFDKIMKVDDKNLKKNDKFKFSVKFKFELCSPEEFQFLEKVNY